MRCVVISQPKSGTYLAANLLQSLGMDFSHIHIDPGMYRVFKNNNLKDFDMVKGNLQKAVSNLKDNQFAVGHILYTKQNEDTLIPYKKILVTRDRKEIKESALRYKNEKSTDVSSIINDQNLDQIQRWSNHGAFVINFKEMIEEDPDKIDMLQRFLFGNVIHNSSIAIEKAKRMESLTKSSIR